MLPVGYEARVLEPSPPAVLDRWYADDPAVPGEKSSRLLVTPTTASATTWDDMAKRHPSLAGFASERWLASFRRLEALPPDFEETRGSLHQLAFFVLAPLRSVITGRIGLRYTKGGFGTPFFATDEQVRIEGTSIIWQMRATAHTVPLTSVQDAAEFVGLVYRDSWFSGGFHDPPLPEDPTRKLSVGPAAAAALADWFGFATSVLEELRAGATDDESVSRVQLWPEHFDPAVELGDSDQGGRASFGASPGDAMYSEPYLYVSPWNKHDLVHSYWNASFGGAMLGYPELLAAKDQRLAALGFFEAGRRLLRGEPPD